VDAKATEGEAMLLSDIRNKVLLSVEEFRPAEVKSSSPRRGTFDSPNVSAVA
jgi:hypothetical protein